MAEQLRSSGLRADLSTRAQEALLAQGERERLGMEVQHLQQRLELQLKEPLTQHCPVGGSGRGGEVDQVCGQSTSVSCRSECSFSWICI